MSYLEVEVNFKAIRLNKGVFKSSLNAFILNMPSGGPGRYFTRC